MLLPGGTSQAGTPPAMHTRRPRPAASSPPQRSCAKRTAAAQAVRGPQSAGRRRRVTRTFDTPVKSAPRSSALRQRRGVGAPSTADHAPAVGGQGATGRADAPRTRPVNERDAAGHRLALASVHADTAAARRPRPARRACPPGGGLRGQTPSPAVRAQRAALAHFSPSQPRVPLVQGESSQLLLVHLATVPVDGRDDSSRMPGGGDGWRTTTTDHDGLLRW